MAPHKVNQQVAFIEAVCSQATSSYQEIPDIIDSKNLKQTLRAYDKLQWFRVMKIELASIN
eukprot:Ihof_evm26s8 gene=Ihof_evmTU26s8